MADDCGRDKSDVPIGNGTERSSCKVSGVAGGIIQTNIAKRGVDD